MEICKIEDCTGCMGCLNICPYGAILEKQNKKGFYVPVIIEEKCVQCGLCQRICPVNNYGKIASSVSPEVFACWNVNETVRQYSSSGGIFTLLAETILEMGGCVFGVVFDSETNLVKHQKAKTMEGVRPMVGSKYVQSQVGYTFSQVKKELETGHPVLFSGTPCQCAGLKSFLRYEPQNLYLIDIVCHGVPSAAILKMYLKDVSQGSRVETINFREKNPSWERFSMKISFNQQHIYQCDMYSDPYLRLFLENYNLNDCCYTCHYANVNRSGDITLGDFWGYLSESMALLNDNKGINLVLVNSLKGRWLFEKIKNNMVYTSKTISEALAGNQNLTIPSFKAIDSNEFWNDFFRQINFSEMSVLNNPVVRHSLKHKIRLLIDKYFFLMPKNLKKQYRRIKQQNAERKREISIK